VRIALGCCAVLLLLAGCGGVQAADLFIVTRTGPTPAATLTLLVNEEGRVTCNGTSKRMLNDAQLVQARTIQEDLHDPANHHLSLAAGPHSVFTYTVRDPDGTVHFSDNSPGQLSVMRRVQLFVVEVARQSCGLSQ